MEAPLLSHNAAAAPPSLVAEDGDYVPARGFSGVRKVFWMETVKLWEIAAPIAIYSLCQYGLFSVTLVFVGHMGNLELSAASLALSVISTFCYGFLELCLEEKEEEEVALEEEEVKREEEGAFQLEIVVMSNWRAKYRDCITFSAHRRERLSNKR